MIANILLAAAMLLAATYISVQIVLCVRNRLCANCGSWYTKIIWRYPNSVLLRCPMCGYVTVRSNQPEED